MGAVKSNFTWLWGARIHYLSASSDGSRSVLTIHGAGTPAALRAPARKRSIEMLSSFGLNVYAPDLPGFGLSELPDAIKSFEDFSAFIAAFLEELMIDRISLVGTSMGGLVASAFASEHPETVERLVLVGSLGIPLKETTGMPSDESALINKLFYDKGVAEAYVREGAATNTLEELQRYMHVMRKLFPSSPDIRRKLKLIKAPTLLVWGEHDAIIPLKYAYEFQRLIEGARVYVVKCSGHLPQVEKPEETHRVIAKFLLG